MMTSANKIVLETRNLNKLFGALRVTKDVSLSFETGKNYAIIGPNGAGKTTFFNLLSGNIAPTTGTVMLRGQNVTTMNVAQRARLGLARSFQLNSLFQERTVLENLVVALAINQGMTQVFWRPLLSDRLLRSRALSLAERIGLQNDLEAEVHHLSYGSQRQLEVGLALACDPTVILLDEPTAGMSPEETSRMHRLIASFPEELTTIIVEHDMDIVLDISDRIVVLDYGSVLVEGTPEEIRNSDIVRRRYLGETTGKPDMVSEDE